MTYMSFNTFKILSISANKWFEQSPVEVTHSQMAPL